MSTENYHIGIVSKATIWLRDGTTLDLTNVSIEVEVERESLQHYAMNSEGRREITEHVIDEHTTLILKDQTRAEIQELIRLIRED